MHWPTALLALGAASAALPAPGRASVIPVAPGELVQAALRAAERVVHGAWDAVGSDGRAQEPAGIPVEAIAAVQDVQVFRFRAEDIGWDRESVKAVREAAETLDLDIWHTSADRLDVLVPSSWLSAFASALPAGLRLPSKPLLTSDDLVSLIAGEQTAAAQHPSDGANLSAEGGWNVSTLASTFHDAYRPLEDVSAFLAALEDEFEGAARVVLGTSAEGREIEGIRIHLEPEPSRDLRVTEGRGKWMRWSGRYAEADSQGDEEGSLKAQKIPEFFLMGGQHAREWISPATLLYFAHALLVKARTDATVKRLLERFEFTIVPTINPDGYVFSHGRSRLWKKNRQAIDGRCVGIDMNANWGYKWSSKPSFGSATKPCSDSYPGSAAFQAVEARAIADYITSPDRDVRAFVDIHSYGQLFMFPYSYSCSDFPGDAESLMEAGLGVAKAIKDARGTIYKTGQACDLVYRMAGDSIDFAYGEAGVRWAYSAELRDTGTYGFLLPPHLIRPTGEEMTSGLLYLAEFIRTTELGPR